MYEDIKFIHHHTGMGDHISCHGIVRHYCEITDKVGVFVQPHNLENVKYMFNDIKNLFLFEMYDSQAFQFVSEHKITDIIRVGDAVGGNTSKCKRQNFEEDFYIMSDVPVKYKTEKFYINRDIEKEKELFNSLNLTKGEYIFVHDKDNSFENGSHLKFLPNNIRIVKPTSHGLFDWMYVIENAKEIHCINSSFICLIDCMDTGDVPLFNHRYVQKHPEYIKIFTTKNWTFYE